MTSSGVVICTSTVWLSTPSMPTSEAKPPNVPTGSRRRSAWVRWPTARIRRSARMEAGASTAPRTSVRMPEPSTRHTRAGSGRSSLPVPA